jgi:transcriptional regulator with XRE-family HTH domain
MMPIQTGSTLPEYGNTLLTMRKRTKIAMTLAANLKELMSLSQDLRTGPQVARRSGIAQKTINNIQHSRHDPKLSSVEALARAFGLQPHQLLCPLSDRDFLTIAVAYNRTDSIGRQLLTFAAESAEKRIHDSGAESSPKIGARQ